MDTKSNKPEYRDKINRHDYIKSILDKMQEYAIYSDSYYLAIGRSTLKIIVSDIFDDLSIDKIEGLHHGKKE